MRTNNDKRHVYELNPDALFYIARCEKKYACSLNWNSVQMYVAMETGWSSVISIDGQPRIASLLLFLLFVPTRIPINLRDCIVSALNFSINVIVT